MTNEDRYGLLLTPKRDITLVRGAGALVYDDQNKEYIDCIAGVAVASVGHSHPNIVQAIQQQARTLMVANNGVYNDVRGEYLKALVTACPGMSKAFLCNSGAESIEAAIKFVRLSTKKTRIICAMRGFHGRTFAAMSATHKTRNDCAPNVDGFTFVPFNSKDALKQAMDDDVAAILLEPVQGDGGVHLATTEYLEHAKKLCEEHNALLVLDEVQTGFGRTGTLFAYQQHGIIPDVLCLAKGIAAGFPMGAVLVTDCVNVPLGSHNSTFGGNPLACAVATATLSTIQDEHLCRNARILGDYIVDAIRNSEFPRVREVRGAGLLIGIELKESVMPVVEQLQEKGILVTTAGRTVLRLLPPLALSYSQAEKVVLTLQEVLS